MRTPLRRSIAQVLKIARASGRSLRQRIWSDTYRFPRGSAQDPGLVHRQRGGGVLADAAVFPGADGVFDPGVHPVGGVKVGVVAEPASGAGGPGDSRPGPRRYRRQPALDARMADPGGESPPCRARAVDGRARVPDRQQARQRVRLVRGRGRVMSPRWRGPARQAG